MAYTRNKIGHGLARVFGIKLEEQHPDLVSRGESVFSISSADTYVEAEPTVGEWIQEHTPSGHQIVQYFLSLFPFLQWITRYNFQWLVGDLVAGIRFHIKLNVAGYSQPQESRSARLSCHRVWLMPNWLHFPFNSVYTPLSWASSYTGSLPLRKISPSA
jgi:hypothetical protein